MSPYSGRDCVKSLRSFYTGLYPQMCLRGCAVSWQGSSIIIPAKGRRLVVPAERENALFDNQLVRNHCITEMVQRTGLAPCVCEFPFPGSLTCTFVAERECFIDNLLVRIHFSIVMIRWTGLAPWVCEFPFPGSRI